MSKLLARLSTCALNSSEQRNSMVVSFFSIAQVIKKQHTNALQSHRQRRETLESVAGRWSCGFPLFRPDVRAQCAPWHLTVAVFIQLAAKCAIHLSLGRESLAQITNGRVAALGISGLLIYRKRIQICA